MLNETKYLNLAGHMLIFSNPEALYPVNRYQSLVLATASEYAALLVAARRGCQVQELSAWEPCCGGGPAAIALKSIGLRYVQATDINEDALNACRANAWRNSVALDSVHLANMLDDGGGRSFDIIACNPPCFVDTSKGIDEGSAIQQAILSGRDGMASTHRLLSQAASRLSKGGSLIFVTVSTGHVRRLANWLSEMFPQCWRTFPTTPVAAPYARIGDPRLNALLDPSSLEFRPMIWQRPDGWYWRITWIVEVTPSHLFFPGPTGAREPSTGFSMCPFGYEVSLDPGLQAMIKEFSADEFWLDA